jgi:hypothetical protein
LAQQPVTKLINMKIFGYFLLVVGIFAVCVPRYPAGKMIGALEAQQVESMPQQETYSRADLLAAMTKFAFSIEAASGEFPIVSVLVMLSGGILIDVGSRRKKQPNTVPNSN